MLNNKNYAIMKKVIITNTEFGLVAHIDDVKPKFIEKETNNMIACFDVSKVFVTC